jgi:hypothetical protein
LVVIVILIFLLGLKLQAMTVIKSGALGPMNN